MVYLGIVHGERGTEEESKRPSGEDPSAPKEEEESAMREKLGVEDGRY